MKRKAALGTGILAMVLCLAMGFTAYAQGWEQDGNGWWYSTDSGYLSNGFSQIDGKWYYFNPVSDGTKGAMAADTEVDGYTIGADGAAMICPAIV